MDLMSERRLDLKQVIESERRRDLLCRGKSERSRDLATWCINLISEQRLYLEQGMESERRRDLLCRGKTERRLDFAPPSFFILGFEPGGGALVVLQQILAVACSVTSDDTGENRCTPVFVVVPKLSGDE